tara:strand:+ start:862 stop:1170 length:309 start_codon:yes stop_codon:yes gene_type:complete
MKKIKSRYDIIREKSIKDNPRLKLKRKKIRSSTTYNKRNVTKSLNSKYASRNFNKKNNVFKNFMFSRINNQNYNMLNFYSQYYNKPTRRKANIRYTIINNKI